MTEPHIPEDAYMINVQMRDYEGDIYLEGRKLAFRQQPVGHTAFFDYRRQWRARLRSPFSCVNFHVDRRAFGAAFKDDKVAELDSLNAQPGEPVADPELYRLAQAISPVFDRPGEVNRLFMEHIGWTLCTHLADRYGIWKTASLRSRGGLAAWQERRAKDMIDARLDGDLSVETLAQECGLSQAHFARSFRNSVGIPPHQWLLTRRVEKARQLLMANGLSVADIAAGCGFADQSHLTRVFKKFVGMPPQAWRKLHSRRSGATIDDITAAGDV